MNEYFQENLKKENINFYFGRELPMNIARYLNKTFETIQKFLKMVPEIIPVINKTTKKGEEGIKKQCILVQKLFNSGYKELVEWSLKSLSLIQDFLQNLDDLCKEWGKSIKETLKITESSKLNDQNLFKTEVIERLVLSTIMMDYTLFSTLNISNIKEISKSLKNFKV